MTTESEVLYASLQIATDRMSSVNISHTILSKIHTLESRNMRPTTVWLGRRELALLLAQIGPSFNMAPQSNIFGLEIKRTSAESLCIVEASE